MWELVENYRRALRPGPQTEWGAGRQDPIFQRRTGGHVFTCNTFQGLAPVHTLHFNKAEQRRGGETLGTLSQHHNSFCRCVDSIQPHLGAHSDTAVSANSGSPGLGLLSHNTSEWIGFVTFSFNV